MSIHFINDLFNVSSFFDYLCRGCQLPDDVIICQFVSQNDTNRLANAENSPFATNPRACVGGVYHIVYNDEIINNVPFSKKELAAMVAHELGHIIEYRSGSEDDGVTEERERRCDKYAVYYGLGFDLATAMSKLSNCCEVICLKDRLLSLINGVVLFRPEWTCGRYVQHKHAAIYYNLITGMCYTFEGVSADLMGCIFNRPRNSSVEINDITASLELPIEDVLAFLSQLIEIGLISLLPITRENVAQYRSFVAKERRSNHQAPTKIEDRLPFEHNNAEMEFANNVGGITSVMLELTYNCTEKCIHCYNIGATRNDEEVSHRGDLSEINIEDYRRIIDQFYEHGLFKVCLSGGDPFSKPIVWEIIQYLYDRDIAFDVYTNAQRLDGKESRLADFYPRLVAVSIYSAIPEIHDYITRTKGSLDRSLRVMTRLGELSVPMNLKCCIMRPNMKSYFTVIDIADTVGAVPQFEVSITDSIEGDKCASKFLRLKENELEVILRDSRIPLYVGPEIPDFGRGNRDLSENACGAGYNSFCIRPDGKMIACCSFHIIFGDLTNQSVEEILSDSTSLKEWRSLSVKDYYECGKQDYCPYCNLCPGNNFSQNCDPKKAGENNCYMAKVRYNLSLKLKSGIDVLDGKSVEDKIREFEYDVTPLRRIKG